MQEVKDKRVPLIGILMHNGSEAIKPQFPSPGQNYFYLPASYVSWINQTGAIAVLVPNTLSSRKLQAILDSIDGFLFPGGTTQMAKEGVASSHLTAVKHVIAHSKRKFDQEGVLFPIFGICHGFQALCVAHSDFSIMKGGHNDTLKSHPVVLDDAAYESSKFFAALNQEILSWVFENAIVYYWHHFGISPDSLKDPKYASLTDEILFLGFSKTGENHDEREFAAVLEHKKYPFYATQFHPEKIQFERGDAARFIDRSAKSVMFAFEVAMKFVEIARTAIKHDRKEPNWLKPFFSSYMTPTISPYADFEQIYVVPRLFDELDAEQLTH